MIVGAASAPLAGRLPRPRISWTAASTAVMLVALIGADVSLQPALLNTFQIGLEVQTALTLVFLGVAQTLVVLVRGIDLSVGGIMVVANVLTATWVGGAVGSRELLIVVVLLIGAAMGAFNGVLVAFLGFQPFVATLATWTIFNGIAIWLLPTDGGAAPPDLTRVVVGSVGSVPTSFVILAGVFVCWWYFRGTRFGRAMYAVGSDEERAHLNGVDVRRTKLAVYAVAGLVSAMAGVYLVGTTSTGTPTAGDGYILQSVAAVVIGGTSLLGGSGGVGLTVMATFVLTIIADVVSALNLSVWVAVAASAGLLLAVVSVRSFFELRWRTET